MKYVPQSFEEIKIEDAYKKIALVAHNCYQVNKDKDQKKFVLTLLGFKHYAMVEHKVFVAKISERVYEELVKLDNSFIVLAQDETGNYCSFTLRVLLEAYEANNLGVLSSLVSALNEDVRDLFKGFETKSGEVVILSEEQIDELTGDVYDKMKTVTLKIVTDRGVTHELVRHRICSFAQESTRYCNYGKNKFGNELTFILPLDYEENKDVYDRTFANIEKEYMGLIEKKVTPEMARAILPNKLKTSIIITTNVKEYKVIFGLRCAQRAHPDIRDIMIPIQAYFVEQGYIKE